MENLLISFNVIAPVFLLLALGYFIKRIGLANDQTLDQMNDVAFKIFFPVLLFDSVYKTDLHGSFQPKLFLFGICSVMSVFLLLMLLIPRIEKDNRKRGVLVQGIFRSNFVIFGMPISVALCGEGNIGPVSLLIAIIVPIYNVFSIFALEYFRGGKVKWKSVLLGVMKNPFVIGAACGAVALLLHLRLPAFVDSTLKNISNLTTPLALILLGASFKFSDIRANLKQLCIGVLGKLVVIPLLFLPIFVLAGFRDVELVALTVMIGAPAAVSSFTMAGKMGGDQVLAGQLVVFDSIGSILTMFLWIFFLKNLGLI